MSKKTYKVAIWEEISGYIMVESDNESEAEDKAEELINQYGVEQLLFPNPQLKDDWEEDITAYCGDHTHGGREVLSCEYTGESDSKLDEYKQGGTEDE